MPTEKEFGNNPYAAPKSTEIPSIHKADAKGPKGLGGWLIVVAIGLIVSCIRTPLESWQIFGSILSDGSWEVLTTPGTDYYYPLWGPFLIFEMLGNALTVVLGLVALYLFFIKSRRFPKWYIWYLSINVTFLLLDTTLGNLIPAVRDAADSGTMKELLRSMISAAIWIPYMKVSKRVRNLSV
ncbi:membrane protein [Formosimonas limnophila]|uniref:Membrane protein n=1 Tax=Formosimonas limnophila TaxID=1384487 RepID=A0A8J3FZZ3_9BURK|nr:DUF2569 domain-containing protein [Formosimonas limnophila]GHA63957.1 membrane protein [Formosimonas limnophila]